MSACAVLVANPVSAGGRVPRISDAEFDHDVLASPLPVVVFFYSSECPPCPSFAGALDDLSTSSSYDGRLAFRKMNMEDNSETVVSYGVTNSRFLMFKDGRPVAQVNLADVSAAGLGAWLNRELE